jgi:hypothetical protein
VFVEQQSFFEIDLPKQRTAQDGPRDSYGLHPNTLALDRPSSLLGKASRAEGQIVPFSGVEAVKYRTFGRDCGQDCARFLKKRESRTARRVFHLRPDLQVRGNIWMVLRPEHM